MFLKGIECIIHSLCHYFFLDLNVHEVYPLQLQPLHFSDLSVSQNPNNQHKPLYLLKLCLNVFLLCFKFILLSVLSDSLLLVTSNIKLLSTNTYLCFAPKSHN